MNKLSIKFVSWVEISRSALVLNLSQFSKLVGKDTEIIPVIKSNAYGHGMVEVAKSIAQYTQWFAVASLGEALALRQQFKKQRVLVLSYADQHQLTAGVKKGIDFPLYDFTFARNLSRVATKVKLKARVHIKIDTGTSRIGVQVGQAVEFVQQVFQLPGLEIVSIWSHYASAEDDPAFTKKQQILFQRVGAELADKGIRIPFQHIGCSAAVIGGSATGNLVRLGLSLYGLWPSEQVEKYAKKNRPGLRLRPVLTWKTRIIQVKTIPKGATVSYGRTYTATRTTKIAVLAVGYWEGYDRGLSNRGVVLVGGKRCPIVGRICMNMTMVNVSKVSDAKSGDEVVLLGRQGKENILAEEIAKQLDTITYEVVTRINPLLVRKIVD